MRKSSIPHFFQTLDHGHEVNTARGRLEGVLQILIERTESDTSEESEVDVTDLIHEGRRYSSASLVFLDIKMTNSLLFTLT